MQENTADSESSTEQQGWSYTPDQTSSDATEEAPLVPKTEEISWTASEFIAHEKSAGWFLVLLLVTISAAGLVYLITKDYISTGVVVLVGIFLGYYARRQPRQLDYAVTADGIIIGQKLYMYDHFKSFSLQQEGAINSIQLTPLKRFVPLMSIYFAPEDEDRIMSAIGAHLPMEDTKEDSLERFMRKIKF